MRIKRGKVARRRRKAFLRAAKGFTGARRKLFGTVARPAVIKAGVYAYRDRRARKRTMRRLWMVRLNAAARERGLSYSKLMSMFKKANVVLNRKMLAELAATDSRVFSKILEAVRK